MGTPIFISSRPTSNDLLNAESLAAWIEKHLACPVEPRAIPWKDLTPILRVLQSYSVQPEMFAEAFSILEGKGIRFTSPPPIRMPSRLEASASQGKQWRAPAFSQKQYIKNTIKWHEQRYEIAIATNNAGEAAEILQAVLDLLWAWASAEGKSRMGRMKGYAKVQEWEEFNRSVNEAFERASMLQKHSRRLSRDDLRRLREAPTPNVYRNEVIRIGRRIIDPILQRRRARRSRR